MRLQRQQEIENMVEALRHLNERKKYFEEQINSYNSYVEVAMATMQRGKSYATVPHLHAVVCTNTHLEKSESLCLLQSSTSISGTFRNQARLPSLVRSSIVDKTCTREAYSYPSTNFPQGSSTRSTSSFLRTSLECSLLNCSTTLSASQIAWQWLMSDWKTFCRLSTKTEHHSPYLMASLNLISICCCIRSTRSKFLVPWFCICLIPFPPQILCMNSLLSDIMYHSPLINHSPTHSRVSLIDILCGCYDTLSHASPSTWCQLGRPTRTAFRFRQAGRQNSME
jgi:hypothetical protein